MLRWGSELQDLVEAGALDLGDKQVSMLLTTKREVIGIKYLFNTTQKYRKQ